MPACGASVGERRKWLYKSEIYVDVDVDVCVGFLTLTGWLLGGGPLQPPQKNDSGREIANSKHN